MNPKEQSQQITELQQSIRASNQALHQLRKCIQDIDRRLKTNPPARQPLKGKSQGGST